MHPPDAERRPGSSLREARAGGVEDPPALALGGAARTDQAQLAGPAQFIGQMPVQPLHAPQQWGKVAGDEQHPRPVVTLTHRACTSGW